jgi:hypothetical protein
MPTCPACVEPIPVGVSTCPHCGTNIQEYGSGEAEVRGPRKSSSGLIIGLVIAGVVGFLIVCLGAPIALMLPAVQQGREAARRAQCKNNLKQIGLALHNYHEVHGAFPPAYIPDANGKPMHSWRVLILPQLGEDGLYNEYNFSEPWDGPNNSRLMSRMPNVFACPSQVGSPGNSSTAYAGIFGEHCVFRGAQPVGMKDIPDGTSNTILVGEASEALIPWMKPDDVDVKLHPTIGDKLGLSSHHVGGIHVLLADGSVRFLSQNINIQTLEALFTRDGNETISGY